MTRAIYDGPFRIDLTVRAGVQAPTSGVALARAMSLAAAAGGAPSPASIGLILTDDRELGTLNAAHLGKSGPTDVLSFPLLPPEAFQSHPGAFDRHRFTETSPALEGTFDGSPGTVPGFALPPGRRQHLGDVVVSVERAIEQADEGRGGQTGDVRWSPAQELRLLVTHGTLHLCGWDHDQPVEEAAMRALEARLLSRGHE